MSLYFRIAANDSGGGGYASPEWTASPCYNTLKTSKPTAAAVEMNLLQACSRNSCHCLNSAAAHCCVGNITVKSYVRAPVYFYVPGTHAGKSLWEFGICD